MPGSFCPATGTKHLHLGYNFAERLILPKTLASTMVAPPQGSSIFQSVLRLDRPAASSTQSQGSTPLTLPERE